MEKGWSKRTLELKENLENLISCSKYGLETAILVSSGSFLQRWNLRPSPDLLNQEVQLQKVPTCFVGTLEFEKPWSSQGFSVALRPGCILELPNVTCERALSQTNKISGAQALFLLLLLLFLFFVCLFRAPQVIQMSN